MKNKSTIIIGLALLILIGAQGFYLYKLSDEVGALKSASPSSLTKTADKTPWFPDDPFAFDGWNRDTWDPYSEMRRMQDRINRLFGDSFSRFQDSKNFGNLFDNSLATPQLDMAEKGNQYILKFNVPGVEQSKINVNIKDNRLLNISAYTKQAKTETDTSGNKLLRRERFFGKFQRTITLPEPVDANSLHSKYEDGVLTITLNKKLHA